MQSERVVPAARLTRATVMFADIVGFTALTERAGAENAYLVVTGCLRLLDDIVRDHGGSVDKYLGDCLMAVFGYPVPLDEAESAAAMAALRMRERVAAYNAELELEVPLEVVIGINTGSMVGGDISGPVSREFHVLGDGVNVAARMKARAPLGRIYVGPETHARTRRDFEYRVLEPMKFKGKSARVATYELVGSRTSRSRGRMGSDQTSHCDLVGRGDELDRLTAFVRRLCAGQGGVLELVGEEGAGKSRLLAELASEPELANGGVALLHVRAGAAGGDSGGDLVADLLAAVGDAAARAENATGEALARSLERLATDRPLLVAIDDLDCADAVSLAALREQLALDRSIGFLLAFPPSFCEVWRRNGGGEPAGEEVRLAPLDADECRQLVDALVGERGMPDETRARIEARARGNPSQLIRSTFLAPALRSDAAEGPADAERRRATILFADISGFTSMTEKLGAEKAYPIVAECLELLDQVARKYGGTVEKYLGDCVMALFGVPKAIEDAPRAAINAAIEMRRRVHEYNEEHGLTLRLDVHSGINTGLGIAGDISGPMVRESAVMGDPVSIADLLKDLASEGEIFVGSEAQRLTRDAFEFRPLAPIALKGRDASVPAFELVSDDVRLYRARIGGERQVFSELVGRDEELGLLEAAARRAAAGEGGIVSVVAEAGLGKSRLIAELAASDAARPLVWLEGRALSTGQQLSFHPFADLLRSWSEIDDDDDEESARSKLEATVARLVEADADEVFPLVATLMGMRLDPKLAGRIEQIQGDALARRIQLAVREMLRRESEGRPLVVVLDDLHWADQSSIELLEVALGLVTDHPILFLHLSRHGHPTTSQRTLEFVRQHHGERHSEIRLEPLDARAARQLIHNLFRRGDIPFETRQLIESKAQGNPFYIEEVVRSLVDEGAVEYRDGSFRATEKIHAVEIPGTVQEVVMARVDRLDPEKRRLLQVASVVGGSFHRDVLAELHGEERLDAFVEDLIRAEFIIPWDRTAGIEYAFKHPIIQEVTYDGLLEAKREELHRAVAGAMDARLPPDLPGFDGMLAYHLSMGRDVERAEEYLFRAGDEAARAAGSSEALHFFHEASKLYFDLHGDAGDPTKKALLQKRIAQAFYYRGQMIEAVDAFNRAMEFLGERIPRAQSAMVMRFVVNLVSSLARLYAPGRRRRPEASDVDREIMDLMFRRSLCEVTADATRFLFDSIAMLGKLSRFDPSSVPGAGGMYAGTSVLFSYGGISFAIARRLLGVAGSAVDSDVIEESILYRVMNFTHHFFEGDWRAEHEIPEPFLEEALHTGKTWDVLTYLSNYSEKRICTGDFAEARAGIEFNDKIWEQYQNDGARSQHGYLTTYLLLEQRNLPEALRAADEYYEDNPEALLHVNALGFRAKAQVLLGDLEGAAATLDLCASTIAELGSLMVPHYQKVEYLRSRLLLEVTRLERAAANGERAEQNRRYRQALRIGRQAQRSAHWKSPRQPEIHRLVGLAHWWGGRRRRALDSWRRSVAIGQCLGARPELARAYLELGCRLGDSSAASGEPSGVEYAVRARNIFEELGLSWDLEQLSRAVSE
jgi:class 3 adenylate cyclase/tetratricopeptide (TPR) repeat protein/ABC-type cobalamin transport system ATPase subunit